MTNVLLFIPIYLLQETGTWTLPGIMHNIVLILENTTKDIVSIMVVDKQEVDGNSTNMEKRGFIKAIEDLKDKGMTVSEVVTDAHIQIMAAISK